MAHPSPEENTQTLLFIHFDYSKIIFTTFAAEMVYDRHGIKESTITKIR